MLINQIDPFRIQEPSSQDLDKFHRDGLIIYPDIMKQTYREDLIEEVLAEKSLRTFINLTDTEKLKLDQPTNKSPGSSKLYFLRPWNNRGPLSDALIDAPLVTALLQSTIGTDYHFCHSSMNLSFRGANRIAFHQDHHHWKHENPVNIAERHKYYVQILYYPSGFVRGDRSLMAIPGSHLIAPTKEVTADRILAGDYDEEVGRKLETVQLELPPGSFVFINARMFHAVDPKPLDSPEEFRMFLIDIFKEAGPPHRYTQGIPKDWMLKAGPERKKLFDREPYTESCWIT